MQIKHGTITEINAEEVTAKVTFSDEDDLVSYDLPVMSHAMGFAKFYSMPKVGMTAVCGFLESTGIEDGFIIGSFYNDENKPLKTGLMHYIDFEDGALVEYNEESKTMTLKSGGGGILLDDNVTISKGLRVSDDVVAGSVSLQKHVHSGVQNGSGNTGGPT